MSSILGLIRPEPPELFAHQFKKIAIFDFVYTLASTIINNSAPNLVKLYMTIRSRLSLIMGVIGLEQLQLFALESEKLLYLTLLASTNIKQSAPNLVKQYRAIRYRVSLIMVVIGPEQVELFVLEFKKIAIFHFVYTVASTNINQLIPKMVKIYMTLRSHMSLIKVVIGPEQVELIALELESLLG